MKFLSLRVRNKAIEIANALLKEETMQEGVIVATAISRAKDWAANHGIEGKSDLRSKTADVKGHGQDRDVIARPQNLAIKKEAHKKVAKKTKAPETVISAKARNGKLGKKTV
jgi:uncharacterized protein YdaT